MKKISQSKDAKTVGQKMWALTNYGFIRAIGYTRKQCREDGANWIGSDEELDRRLKDGSLDFRRVTVVDRP